MGNDVIGKSRSESSLELDQPVLACSCFHSAIIFPVDVDTVEMISNHEVSQIVGGFDGIFSFSGWELSGSES